MHKAIISPHTAQREALLVKTSAVVFVLAVFAMIILVDIPPVLDFPNHYARLWLISGGIQDETMSKIYRIDWSRASFNLGTDIVAYYLGPWLGAKFLTKTFLALSIILPPLGGLALSRHVSGRFHILQIGILFFAWCATAIGGFMNFQIALGFALFFAAADDLLRPKGGFFLFIWRALAFGFLMVIHPISACLFPLLSGALEFSSTYAPFHSRHAFFKAASRVGLILLACVLPLVAILLAAKDLPVGSSRSNGIIWPHNLSDFLSVIESMLWTYNILVDTAFLIPLVMVVLRLRRTGGYAIHAGLQMAALLLFVITLIAPVHVLGNGWLAWRFPIMMAFTAFAMIIVDGEKFPSAKYGAVAALLLISVFGRMAWIGFNWWSYQDDVRQVRTVLSALPPGASIIPVGSLSTVNLPFMHANRAMAANYNTFRHLATLAVPQSKDFVPTMFTSEGQQPLAVTKAYEDIDIPQGGLVPWAFLACPKIEGVATSVAPYLKHWRQRFDYILQLNADLPGRFGEAVLPDGIQLVASTRFAKLYHIDRNWSGMEASSEKCDIAAEKVMQIFGS